MAKPRRNHMTGSVIMGACAVAASNKATVAVVCSSWPHDRHAQGRKQCAGTAAVIFSRVNDGAGGGNLRPTS